MGEVIVTPDCDGALETLRLTDFLGWTIVGCVTIALFQPIDRVLTQESIVDRGVKPILCGVGLYYLILIFNLVMTFIIGEMLLGITGILLYAPITWMVFTRSWQWGAARSFASPSCGVVS